MIPTSRYMGGRLVAKRRNRRWYVAFYWGFIVPADAFVVGHIFARAHQEWIFYVAAVVMVLNLWTMSRFGLKPMGPLAVRPDPETLRELRGAAETREIMADWTFDEREARERDRAVFRAYRWMLSFSFLWFAALTIAEGVWPECARWLGPVFLTLLIAVIAGLPQSLILWTEPDVEEAR